MTTRPNPGGPQRQTQRSLSANITQRPPPSRTLSQQFPPSSPVRRNNEAFTDLPFDGPDPLGRYGTIPRNGGSRLKLEISKDSRNPTFVESPKATSDTTPLWKPSLPPRGRPQLHFDVPSVSNPSPRPSQDGEITEVVIKPMPLPVRPGLHTPPVPEKSRAAPIHVVKKDVRPKPYTLEVPTAAPHFAPNGHADFYPWTGNLQEDQFSESAIRQGFYDKAQITQNEMGSAKAAIFPGLKHRQGLATLSALFANILGQRRSHGQITSSSTFKPPPRVTVTDTKREMWLKDLANPTISLRRLSRSIPHGIRGKVLLDQSLSKNIPIERAVWLAKCVGANELRSFRRKGASGTFAMGGEAKWIRDFTVCVEQFVESIVGTCGETDFKARINYAIRLATHFHAEHLLDREHYMDWLVSSLENCPQAKLPMWLLITQIYWKDLLSYRKFGRRLSATLLNHMVEITSHPDRDILERLYERLKTLLKGLMISNPESFIIPRVWMKSRETIQCSILPGDSRFEIIFTSIDRRNTRFATTGSRKSPLPRQSLIALLDTTLSKAVTNEMIKHCWQLDNDKSMLMQTLIEWSTSSHRPGTGKTFVATRMLRQWSRSGADITDAILNFLDSKACEKGRSKSAFYHLVSELSRSEHFSTPIYLQWIIGRGGLYDTADVSPDGPCASRLLAEIPTHNLTESMIHLRRTLLDRVRFSVDFEEEQTRAHMAFLNKSLPGMQAHVDFEVEFDDEVSELFEFSTNLSRTIKSEIGLWIRQKVGLQMIQPTIPPLDDWDDSPMKGGTSAITSSDFNTIRRYLELVEDYSILADVLKIVTSSNDAEVLASCTDTLNLHSDAFSAIGALGGLFEALMTRLRALAENDSLPRVLLVSLSDLAGQIPEQKAVGQQLSLELARSDRKTAADACSPVSDHMAGVMQTAEADFSDEIEKILASGNSMDQGTLERLFQRIVLRLEDSWEKCPEQHRSCGLLLTRLRTFDAPQFDTLMGAWVNRFLQIDTRPSMMQVLGPLISFGCLSLHDVARTNASKLSRESTSDHPTPSITRELLDLIISPSNLPDLMTVEEMYRFSIKQRQTQQEHPSDVLPVIRCTIQESTTGNGNQGPPEIDNLLTCHEFKELLHRLVLVDTDLTMQLLIAPILQNNQPGITSIVTRIVDKLLAAEEQNGGSQEIPIESVLGLADDFTLPFCQIKLASMFKPIDLPSTSEDTVPDNLQAFDKAIESAVEAENTSWACIIPLLDLSLAQHVRTQAESQFLSLFPSSRTISEDIPTSQARIKQAENLLYIIDASAYSIIGPLVNSSMPSEMVMVFNNSWLLLSSTTQNGDIKNLVIDKWLPLLLSFATIHASSFEATKPGHENRARALLALAAILLELCALPFPPSPLVERIFDLGLVLVDGLPDDMRQQCIRGLRDTASNPRIGYMFSIAANLSEWLVLSQKEKIGGVEREKLAQFPLRRWEMLGEPTPNVGENDTSLSLTLFGARRG